METADWTVSGLLHTRATRTPDAPGLWQLNTDGEWVSATWRDYQQSVASLAKGFGKLGMTHGDRVGIMSASCKEWDYAQLGIMAAGGVAVGLDPYGLDEHTREICHRCDFVGLVLGNVALLDKLDDQVRQKLRFIVTILPSTDPGIVSIDSLMSEQDHDEPWNLAQPDSVATVIFTSGTTGAPKGIEYSHRQMCLAAASILSAFSDISEGSHLACWLPLSNLFQRIINLCAVARGAQTFYVADPKDIMRFVSVIEPHVFIGVPRFYEKLHAGIQEALAKKPTTQQRFAHWALRVGGRHSAASRAGHPTGWLLKMQMSLAERMVLRRLRAMLGRNLRFMISGSAPMPVWLLESFHAMGLPVLEAYGISENIIPVSLNRPDQFRFGSVGRPLQGCEVRLASDGELLVRGPGVFRAYFGEGTVEARVDSQGFLSSGDFANIDTDGFITLIGRKSEIFKTSTGRRVAPSRIESLLRQLQHVEFAAVFGAGRVLPTALVIVNETAWQENHHQLCLRLRHEAQRTLAPLPAYLRPVGLAVSTQMFTIAGGELTANLKMRRHAIATNFGSVLNELCVHIDNAVGEPFEVHSKDGLLLFFSL